MVADLRAVLKRIGNVRYQRALFGADLAALNAETPIDTVRSVSVRARKDCYRTADAYSDAQLRAALDQNVSASAHGMRPIWIAVWITPWKVGRSGHRNFLFEQFVVRLYFLIGDWPVNADAIFRMNSEIGRMQTRSETGPMDRAAPNPTPAIVCTESEGILAARYAELIPIEIVGPSFIAHPVSFGIPKWACFEADDAETSPSKPLQQHPTRRSDADNAVVDLFGVRVAMHRHFDVLYGSKHMIVLWRFEGTQKRLLQCVPPCAQASTCVLRNLPRV